MAKIDIFAEQKKEMVCSLEGQKIYIYGGNDTGKTFQTTRMEKPALLMTEAGGNARSCPKFPIEDWDDFTTIVKQFTTKYEDAKKLYQTIIIDTVEELVALSESKVAKKYGVLDVGMVQEAEKGNPNGYLLSRNMFKQQVNLLTKYGYTVVFIGHVTEIDYEDPDTNETYKKIMPFGTDKEKGSTKFVRNLCDFVIYTKEQGIDKETGNTIYSKAICKETKNVFARSRYAMQTYIDSFTAETLKEALEKAIEKSAKDEGAGLSKFKINDNGFTKEDYVEMITPYVTKIHKLYPDYVTNLLETNLGLDDKGKPRKLSQATKEEITELGNIYSELVTYCCDRGIVVED